MYDLYANSELLLILGSVFVGLVALFTASYFVQNYRLNRAFNEVLGPNKAVGSDDQ